MGKLDGKVAIITGAARGLGRAYAKRLAGLGAKVAVADLNLRSYEEFEAEAKDMTADSTVAEIEAAGGTALGIEVDVRDHEAVEAMVGSTDVSQTIVSDRGSRWAVPARTAPSCHLYHCAPQWNDAAPLILTSDGVRKAARLAAAAFLAIELGHQLASSFRPI